MASLFAHADDTEIYTGLKPTIPPNVIFVMDTSGSMAWAGDGSSNPPTGQSRLEIVKKAAINTINATDNINISLMRFNVNNEGGHVSLAMSPIATGKSTFETKLNSFSAGGGTPITESLHEALRYLRGDPVGYGSSYTGDTNAYTSGSYNSPITHKCQQNHIVLFSDGEPSVDKTSDSIVQTSFNSLPSTQKTVITANTDVEQCGAEKEIFYQYSSYNSTPYTYNAPWQHTHSYRNPSTYKYTHYYKAIFPNDGTCAEELALTANATDLTPAFEGMQNVTIHTVGGFVENDAAKKLEDIARFGSWAEPNAEFNANNESSVIKTYFVASDSDGLEGALTSIFDNITTVSTTFTAPAVSVNAFNNLEHLDQLYYSVFKPSKGVDWAGNLKRYRLTPKGNVHDVNDELAVDESTGFFADSAQSFWTLNKLDEDGVVITGLAGINPDGKEVEQGGAASRLSTTRNIYTYLGSNKTLKNSVNKIHESNSNITTSLLGPVANSGNRTQILQWARGIDVKDQDGDTEIDDARVFMEDPLHSQPLVITYGKNESRKTFDSSIFMATNSGYLHAFSTDENNPQEHFSFIPQELLGNIGEYYAGERSLNKVYGLDGPMSYWHDDRNFNGVILDKNSDIETGEHIYLYTGMRRGGRSYYALDISDRDDPKFLWQIDNTMSDFSKLGQTWSKMTPATVKFEGQEEKVLFFGGGYDPAEDNKSTRSSSTMGNSIYMVKASDGSLLWNSSNSGAKLNLTEMKNSIVSDIIPIDSTLDGYINILYTADVGGRVWRIDLDSASTTAENFAKGGVVADFNGGTASKNIRFFNTPDISFTRYGGFSADGQLQISIGSGYRAHPLNTNVVDRFYIINDIDVTTVPTNYSAYSESDLANAKSFSSASEDQQKAGAYYSLTGEGEKVLASSITVTDNILFTTYRPTDASLPVSCDANTGYTRLYHVKPIAPQTPDDNPLERDWGLTDLAQGGIPPNPVVLFPPSDSDGSDNGGDEDNCPEGEVCDTPLPDGCEQLKSITAIGAELLNTNITRCDQLSKSYWLENK
jgi:type IV pilus assembly protein PilY1